MGAGISSDKINVYVPSHECTNKINNNILTPWLMYVNVEAKFTGV